MRLIHVFFRLFLAAAPMGLLWAQEEPVPLVRADLSYASRDVFRGIARAGQSAQASVEFAREKFRGGVSTNLPFDGKEMRTFTLNAAYSWQFGDALTLEGSARQDWFSHRAAGQTTHSFEAGMTAIGASIDGFTPSVGYFRDLRLRSDTVQAGLAHSIALTKLGAFLDFNFFAGWVKGVNWWPDGSGPPRSDGYGYWGAEVTLPYRVGLHSTVIAGLHFTDTTGLSATNGPPSLRHGKNLWLTLGVSADF